MKKIAYNILLAGAASLLVVQAQTNATTSASSPGETNPPPVVLPATNEVTATPVPAVAPAIDATAVPAPSAGATIPAAPGIPLIQFSDVPITTAIENLARQAGINYLLDPKIGYNQPDASGQIKAEPTLSIRWENISAEQALVAMLDNYGLQLVADKKTSIARITLKDPSAPPPMVTRVVQLKYSSVSNMTEAVQSVLTDKRSKVLADSRTSQIVVSATDPEQLAVDTLVAQLDKPTKQVLIEARFIEVQSSPSTSKGIDWSGTLASQHVSFGNGMTGVNPSSGSGSSGSSGAGSISTTTTPGAATTTTTSGGGYTVNSTASSSTSTLLNSIIQGSQNPGGLSWNTLSGFTPGIGFLNADGVQAVISFLNTSSDAQIISTPRLVTLDNEMARIEVTHTKPVINVTAGTVQNAGGSSVTYSNVGTSLEVTPRISANDFIWLKVVPMISTSPDQPETQIIGGQVYSAPVFDQRSINTQVLIPNGNTLVMGGLVSDHPNSTTTKVPVLGDIPFLGYAFRSESKALAKDNLIIFITPTIVKDTDFRPSMTSFLKSDPDSPEIKSPIKFREHSMWDTTSSADWSLGHADTSK